jgi:hypothetical protein
MGSCNTGKMLLPPQKIFNRRGKKSANACTPEWRALNVIDAVLDVPAVAGTENCSSWNHRSADIIYNSSKKLRRSFLRRTMRGRPRRTGLRQAIELLKYFSNTRVYFRAKLESIRRSEACGRLGKAYGGRGGRPASSKRRRPGGEP